MNSRVYTLLILAAIPACVFTQNTTVVNDQSSNSTNSTEKFVTCFPSTCPDGSKINETDCSCPKVCPTGLCPGG